MGRLINYKIVLKLNSRIMFIISTALIVCIPVSIFYSENYLPFAFAAAIALVLGIGFSLFSGYKLRNSLHARQREAYLTVSIAWLLVCLIGSLPYVLTGSIPLFYDAFFESVSGFTTTGSSILTDIESLPMSVLFWRSLTHWIGGIGIVFFVILIMPRLNISAYQLFTMESSMQQRVGPNMKKIGYQLLLIYISLTIIETVLLRLGGMNMFESVCHSFGTIATGGFSPKNTSIQAYSPYIQYVVMIFMLLSGANFLVYYFLIKRKFRKINENEEFKFYLGIVLLLGIIITSILFFKMQKPIEESIREGFFQVITIVTCTGYATADYMLWPNYAWIILFGAMFLGGSTGSTAGGIKMVRHLVFWKNLKFIFKKIKEPNALIKIRLNKKAVSDKNNTSILTYIGLYLLLFIFGSIVLMFLGIDGLTASSSVATCMAGIGPGMGSVGPANNFAHLPDAAKVILSFLMVAGRLEIYTIAILFTRNFWKP